MSYPITTLHSYQTYINETRFGSSVVNKPDLIMRGTSEDFFQSVRPDLLKLLDKWKKQIKAIGDNAAKKEVVEAQLSSELFRSLHKLPVTALTDSDFWRFLSCHYFFEFTLWRDGENCALASFGANANTVTYDCVPYRMFNRALVAFGISEDIDDLSYAEVPGTDLWRSHLLRVLNSFSSTMSQALLDKSVEKKLPTAIIREVVKRLRKNRANVFFEIISYEDASAMIEDEIARAKLILKK